jgi:hypothetical protein
LEVAGVDRSTVDGSVLDAVTPGAAEPKYVYFPS